ncbi:MAG: FprA family A-type flavoprotein [Deferrisomatales bacterium]
MSDAVAVGEGVFWLGTNDRDTARFESLWPLPRGISYNAYLIRDEKVALIDAVKAPFGGDLAERLRGLLGPDRPVDYLVVNHLEPDHSGGLRLLLRLYPELRIVGTPKTAEFLRELYGVSDRVVAVADGETLDLGGRTLRFVHTPMVHWPETMMTFDRPGRILFSGDAFGGYGAVETGLFDDQRSDRAAYEDEALRYFANVIGKYSPMVQKAVPKVRDLAPAVVAPAHGLVWRSAPGRIVDLYDRWSRHDTEPAVVVAYGSMYGNTRRLADRLAAALADVGIADVRFHDVAQTHLSFLLRDIWRARALLLGTPTYNLGIFPAVDALVRLLEDKRLTRRVLGVFGTYGWSGGGVKGLEAFAERSAWELVEPVVEARFAPKEADLARCEELARAVAERLQQ